MGKGIPKGAGRSRAGSVWHGRRRNRTGGGPVTRVAWDEFRVCGLPLGYGNGELGSGLGRFGEVAFGMKSEVVGTGKGPMTHGAREGFRPCVLSVMTGEFVTSRKPPLTVRPLAPVRFLT